MYERGGPTNLFKRTKQTKQTKTKNKNKDALRTNTTVHETIKMKCLEETWNFY